MMKDSHAPSDSPAPESGSLLKRVQNMVNRGQDAHDVSRAMRRYQHAMAVASEVIAAITQRPGFEHFDVVQDRAVLDRLLREIENETTRWINHVREQSHPSFAPLIKAIDSTPAFRAQITRHVAHSLADSWIRYGAEKREVRIEGPDGKVNISRRDIHQPLITYLRYVTSQAFPNAAQTDAPEFMDNLPIDRLMALHSATLRIDEAYRKMEEDILAPLPDAPRSLVRKALLGDISDQPPEHQVERIIDHVVLNRVEDSHANAMAQLKAGDALSQKDRHILFRALLKHISQDVSLILKYESHRLVPWIQNLSVDQRRELATGSGALTAWLDSRLGARLERLYPQPADFRPDMTPDKKNSTPLDVPKSREPVNAPPKTHA